jgi:DNA-nicking Smr family endonuclease
MRHPRGLRPEEAELWARVASTVRPLQGRKAVSTGEQVGSPARVAPASRPMLAPASAPSPGAPRTLDRYGLDGSWDKKLARGTLHPDFTLDLHGHSLDAAHARLDHGLAQAIALGARVVLVITGKPRPAEAADRGGQRGAIRAKLVDWLAAGPHAHRIAALRGAHRRHGGPGALYLILRRSR